MNDTQSEALDDKTKINLLEAPIKQENKTKTVDKFDRLGTRHEAATPLDCEYTPIPEEFQDFTAKEYNFELDTFQKISLCCLERDESVLVSAHTSSGKTVVAEYAIAMSLRNNQRVVYTSPIKALSNQKYRELLEEFEDVGLMTGDVTLNPTASCLVMTTEILRNMLYRGSEVIREVHWIIFDEIHYMRDRERGIVWEETIILLPSHVRMVFLSATIPNALEFAEWISFIQKQIVHVVYTEKRITPLVHYFKTNKLYKIKDNEFHKDEFQRAMKTVRRQRKTEKDVSNVINEISLPAVIFSFRRKDCEYFAMRLENDFLDEKEKETVRTVFNNAIGGLRKEDREIPIIQNILPLLTRGIGIHHSGLLPIVKEIVEILFQEGFLKVLFATETFSIGLNMPAKSVVFLGLKKYDGVKNRVLTSAEYIQMSGRAGRRGIDKMGIVVSLIEDAMSYKELKELFSCSKDNLISAFRLTYNMILNLMRVEGLDPLYLISRSFHHYQAFKLGKKKEAELFELYEKIKQLPGNNLTQLLMERETLRLKRCKELSKSFKPFLKSGRVIDIVVPRHGASVTLKNCIVENTFEDKIVVYALVGNEIKKIECGKDAVEEVYDIRVKLNAKVFFKEFKRIEIKERDSDLELVEGQIKKIVPDFDPDCCFICGQPFVRCLSDCSKDVVGGEAIAIDFDLETIVNRNIKENKKVETKAGGTIDAIEFIKNESLKAIYNKRFKEMSSLLDVYHMDECKKMIKVLKSLGYCDDTTVLVKGRLACEISSGDELVLTEMIFNGDFAKLKVNEFVPLLSCIVFEEWNDDELVLSDDNKRLYGLIENSVKVVCKALQKFNLPSFPKKYLRRFSFELMDVVKMWVDGKTFIQICEATDVFEGSIIRTFKRLEELLKQLCNAARVIGNSELETMFANGILSIKRDIVFANSLYI